MKIYFSTSTINILKNKAHNKDKIEYILKILKQKSTAFSKRTMLSGHDESSQKLEKLGADFFDYIKGTTEDIYKENTQKIRAADVAIFESTYPAEGIGYEMGYAINQKKPVLILVDKTYKDFLAEIIEGIPSNLKQLSFYKDKEDLDKIIQDFLKMAKGMIDTKFIMIISPEIDRYFEWAKGNRRMHKAQIVRDAVFKQMELDPEWNKVKLS